MVTIKSILDNDLYKFSMQHAVIKKFPYARVKYRMFNRGKTQFPEGFAEELRKSVKSMESLFLTEEERSWLQKQIYFFDPTYIDFLSGYRYDSSEVGIVQTGSDLQLTIEGLWYRTILWEVQLMALVSELYFQMTGQNREEISIRKKKLTEKSQIFSGNNVKVAEFGTRRRYSYENQKEVVAALAGAFPKFLVGSANVHLAMLNNIVPIGTQAHEWFMFHAAKYGYKMANRMAMEHWVDVYRGDLGIVLSDTFTTNSFLRSFDKKFAKLYDGVRHDSGDPIDFMEKIYAHYLKLGIDPMSKTVVFSDNLNKESVIEIQNACRGKVKCSFGIGTYLSNDVGVEPLNFVIKMTEAKPEGEDWHQVIKLSDSVSKYTGDSEEIQIAKHVLQIKN